MKKALLVGINYIGYSYGLNGCINDVINIQSYLKSSRGYKDFLILRDDDKKNLPTRNNIFNGIRNLVKDAKKGDELWFHFSGHGVLQRDTNRDEESGQDSCICPVDFEKSGFIIDDDLRRLLVIPDGVKLYVILDCCHSGTGCDLRYKIEDQSYYNKSGKPLKYVSSDWTLKQTMYQFKNYSKSNGDIYMISGCQDSQTSADAVEEGQSQGALTYCLLKTLKNNFGNCKWKVLLKDLRCLLKIKGYTQIPVLTSGKQINTDDNVFVTEKSIDNLLDKLISRGLIM